MASFKERLQAFPREEIVPYFRDRNRKPVRQQVGELARIWRANRYPPFQYLRFRLYRRDRRYPEAYIPTSLLMKFLGACNRGVDGTAVDNKRRFREIMQEAGLPALREEFAVLEESGRIVTPEGAELSRAEAEKQLQTLGEAFVKPIEGRFGVGAFKWTGEIPTAQVFEAGPVLVQPVLQQHPLLSSLHPPSVNAVRIITLAVDGDIAVNGAILRMGAGGHIMDHGSSGGLAAGIDLRTGEIPAPAHRRAQFEPAVSDYIAHPDTGAQIVGITLPFWSDILAMVREGARRLRPLRVLGWDVAFTPEGPVLLEANKSPLVRAFQLFTPLGNTPLGEAARAYHFTGRLADI